MPTTPKSFYRGTVGVGGTLGANWYLRTGAANSNTNGIAFGNGIFYTSNAGGAGFYSTDNGVTWTGSTGGMASLAVGFGAGLFARLNGSTAYTSPDAVIWTTRTLPTGTSALMWNGIAYGAAGFVAVDQATAALTSPDGITWTLRALPSSNVWKIAYGNGVYVAVGQGNAAALTSPDGVTWTTRTIPSVVSSICFGGGLFLAVYSGSNTAYTSPDGVTWTPRTMPFATSGWQGCAYGGGMFVATNTSTVPNFIATSPDAITWTKRTLPVGSVGLQVVAFGNNTFVVTGNGGSAVSSHSGSTLAYTAGPAMTSVLTDVYVSNSLTTATSFTLQIDGLDLLGQTTVAANDKVNFATKQVLDSNKTITAFTNGNPVNVHLNGVEIS